MLVADKQDKKVSGSVVPFKVSSDVPKKVIPKHDLFVHEITRKKYSFEPRVGLDLGPFLIDYIMFLGFVLQYSMLIRITLGQHKNNNIGTGNI